MSIELKRTLFVLFRPCLLKVLKKNMQQMTLHFSSSTRSPAEKSRQNCSSSHLPPVRCSHNITKHSNVGLCTLNHPHTCTSTITIIAHTSRLSVPSIWLLKQLALISSQMFRDQVYVITVRNNVSYHQLLQGISSPSRDHIEPIRDRKEVGGYFFYYKRGANYFLFLSFAL